VRSFHAHISDQDELVERLEPFEVVVLMRERTPFPRAVIERLSRLELIVTTGPVNAAIDVGAANDHGITVCGTGYLTPPTLELTWALILACVKKLPQCDRAVRAGQWQTTLGSNLAGARLGLLGLGRYGSQSAAIGKAFGMELCAWSQNLTEARCDEVGVELVSKGELFATSDVLCIHLKLSARTRGLVGFEELRAMKPTAYLVNTSRGDIIDEPVLVRALRENWLAGAGLDVFAVEPIPETHPLLELGNVVLSPHMGYVNEQTYRIYYRDVVADIVGYLAHDPLRVIDPT
jgi:phosphoglycerate dehydrogenase-like enzyme